MEPAAQECTAGTTVLSTARGARTTMLSPSGSATLLLLANGVVATLDSKSGRTITTLTGPYNQCAQPLRWVLAMVVLPGSKCRSWRHMLPGQDVHACGLRGRAFAQQGRTKLA